MGGPPGGGGWIIQRKWRATGTHTLPYPFTADCVESPSVQEENSVYFVYIASYCEITLPPRAHGLDLQDTEAVTLASCATDTRYIFYNRSLNYYLVLISAVNAFFFRHVILSLYFAFFRNQNSWRRYKHVIHNSWTRSEIAIARILVFIAGARNDDTISPSPLSWHC